MFSPLLLRMQAGLLEAEFDQLNPALSQTLTTINGQITQGFTPEQIALGAIGLPLAYQVIRIAAGYAETHREGIQQRRERENREHQARMEKELELFRATLRSGSIPAVAPEPSRPAQ